MVDPHSIVRLTEGDAVRDGRAERESDALRIARTELRDATEGEPTRPPEVIAGQPAEAARFWQRQSGPQDCAIFAEGTSAEACGRAFNPEALREAGIADETYDPQKGGTAANALGHVWEREGLQVERHGGCFERPPDPRDETGWQRFREESWDRLVDRLDAKRAVVVGVDTAPIWGNTADPPENRGHAIWVTGIEERTGGEIGVVCNDSGREDGRAIVYGRQEFDSAWQARGYQMVCTSDPMREVRA